jgi:hypothetical protein
VQIAALKLTGQTTTDMVEANIITVGKQTDVKGDNAILKV